MPAAATEQSIWFSDLAHRAYECTLCPRMEPNSAVLGPLNGRLEARVIFVGEAPWTTAIYPIAWIRCELPDSDVWWR